MGADREHDLKREREAEHFFDERHERMELFTKQSRALSEISKTDLFAFQICENDRHYTEFKLDPVLYMRLSGGNRRNRIWGLVERNMAALAAED